MAIVHHVEICVQDCKETVSRLRKYGFRLFAKRNIAGYFKQYVSKLGSIFFVVTERERNLESSETKTILRQQPFAVLCCENEKSHTIDSVFNVALSVRNVALITQKIEAYGGIIIQSPTKVEDESGSITYSIVKSCCGNVIHTLLDKSQHTGSFLPGFQLIKDVEDHELCTDVLTLNDKISHIDHVTLATHSGDSMRVIQFYQSCFGMKKFSISSNDDADEGLILEDGVGLRLRAMEYWRCAETGLLFEQPSNETAMNSVLFVVVESLPGQFNCNVETYLREHGQSGVEHIAFRTSSIHQAVKAMKHLSVNFRQPPAAYYEQLKKQKKVAQIAENFEQLANLGILLDNEAQSDETSSGELKYLMQIFAHPLFYPHQTFFIELIQRSGARGLGSGNIIALVKSIREEEKRKARENAEKRNDGTIKSPRSIC